MFTRTARKALRNARQGRHAETSYLGILQAGEKAFRNGVAATDNPYPAGSEDAAIWADGWTDAAENQ